MSRIKMSKNARSVLAQFKKAGIETEVKHGKKHFLVYVNGELAYKLGRGAKCGKVYHNATLEAALRRYAPENP